ncbi:MAG: response regulator transcription factor [Ferrimicrobium sp.]
MVDMEAQQAPRELTEWFRATRPGVLIVEDDEVFREALATYLWEAGAIVSEAKDGVEGLDVIMDPHIDFDIIVLDLLLPGHDGRSIIGLARSAGITTPILVLTALSEPQDRVTGLGIGADDYLGKPVNLVELLWRLSKLIRRRSGSGVEPLLHCGALVVNEAARRAWVGGEELLLSRTEFELLRYLVRRAGLVLTRETIRTTVWPSTDGVVHNLIDSHMAHLRRKLVALDADVSIQTVRGVGYRLRVDSSAY